MPARRNQLIAESTIVATILIVLAFVLILRVVGYVLH
jgi:hypothetical protein